MSSINLPDNAGHVDTFTRTEGEDTVHMQAVVPVNPANGDPLDLASQATVQALQQLNDTMLYMITAMLDKMPRLDKTDRVTVDLADYGMGGSAYSQSIVNATSNVTTGSIYARVMEPWNFSDAGSARLYQQITVSP